MSAQTSALAPMSFLIVHAFETDFTDSLIRAVDRAPIIAARRHDRQDAAARRHDIRSALRRARVKHVDAGQSLRPRRGRESPCRFRRYPDIRPRPEPRRRADPDRATRARGLQLAGSRAHQQRRQIVGDRRQNHLRFRIAEPDIELDDLRAVRSQHQADEQEAAELAALAAHAFEDRAARSRSSRAPAVAASNSELGAYAPMPPVFGPCVAVERALVILGRTERHRARAVAQHEERRFAPDEQLLDDDARRRPGRSACRPSSTAPATSASVEIRGNHDALARREAVRLQHDRKSELAASQHRDRLSRRVARSDNAPSARCSAA